MVAYFSVLTSMNASDTWIIQFMFTTCKSGFLWDFAMREYPYELIRFYLLAGIYYMYVW